MALLNAAAIIANNPFSTHIPQPLADVGSLAVCVQALKQNSEVLTGDRANVNNRAVMFSDLADLGVIDPVSVTLSSTVTGQIGAEGPAGPTGPTGPTGPIGPTGPAGIPGTIVSSTVLAGAIVAITSGVVFDVTHINLTAGTWLVYGNLAVNPGSGTVIQAALAWTSTTSATLPTIPNAGAIQVLGYTDAASDNLVISAGIQLVVVATTATVYLSGDVAWTVAQPGGYGFVGAIRLI